ncbi:MAG: two-component system activity regulator YycH, partial [Candidatus Carbobacillus sp.]|nr:two-component system activity regulator YycH [Candidatus Carbobacillus sp.]
IPEKSLELPVYIDRFVAISTDDAAEALFLDLSTMRQVKERDGGRIFSDGVRSLKIMGDDRIMRYFSPPLPQMRESNENHDAFVSAVQFINRHAGWNGDERLVQRIVQHSGETMIFRSAIDGYPLDTEGDALSYYTIQVELKGEDVVAYERSLWRRISRDGDGRLKLLSAEELMHALKERVRNPIIQNVRISYRAELTSTAGAIRLVPGYAITLVDGEKFFVSGQANDETTS